MSIIGYAQKSPEAFRTISEVADDLNVPQHVLRFWETKFSHIKPVKRGGGRRYYRPDDVDLLRGIRALLYRDGMTIKGAQKVLRERGTRYVMDIGRGDVALYPIMRVVKPEPVPEPLAEPEIVSNIRPFRREAGPMDKAEEPLEVAVLEVEEPLAELVPEGLPDTARTRLETLLDELLEMRARLDAAKSKISVAKIAG